MPPRTASAPRSTARTLVIAFGIAGVAFACFIVALVFGLAALMRSSEAYTSGLATAQADARVVALLGEPVEGGLLVMGSLQTSGEAGEAMIEFPLDGPRGEARLHVEGRRRGGRWTWERMEVVPEGDGPVIDLLQPAGKAPR